MRHAWPTVLAIALALVTVPLPAGLRADEAQPATKVVSIGLLSVDAPPRQIGVVAPAVATAVRVSVFWGLLVRHWRGALGLWATPLHLMLLPDGFLLPRASRGPCPVRS